MILLVTGGAGFIGSHLVRHFASQSIVEKVVVLDNYATGFRENLLEMTNLHKLDFQWGDIREYTTCLDIMKGCTHVCHQAALGSVPRSIKHPVTSNNVNITGTLNIFTAAKELGIKRVVYAASSSTYGDSQELPKIEHITGKPISPYAVTKLVNELYAEVYGKLYDMEFIGLRYFNVFGPRQNPNGAYAAVIPLFLQKILNDETIFVNGDGSYSRDFTYVENVVQANWLALTTENKASYNEVYNVALGEQTSLNSLVKLIEQLTGKSAIVKYRDIRVGDVPHSLASIDKAKQLLLYNPKFTIKKGLEKTLLHYS